MPLITTWLTALAAWPLPRGPRWVIVLPTASKTGLARATSGSAPPTNIVRVPRRAPSDPPETGASTRPTPCSASRRPKSRVASGEIVEQSMTRLPSSAPSAPPPGPKRTASTSGVSDTQTMTTSETAATPDGEAASCAPAFTRAEARPGVRFHTVNEEPALRRLAAIDAPIVPRPTNPTCCIRLLHIAVCRGEHSLQVTANAEPGADRGIDAAQPAPDWRGALTIKAVREMLGVIISRTSLPARRASIRAGLGMALVLCVGATLVAASSFRQPGVSAPSRAAPSGYAALASSAATPGAAGTAEPTTEQWHPLPADTPTVSSSPTTTACAPGLDSQCSAPPPPTPA